MSAILPIGPAPRIAGPYTATAGQKVFTFAFALIEAGDLTVETAPAADPDNWTAATYGTEWTIPTTLPTEAGGNIVFALGRAAGTRVRIVGAAVIANTQDPLPAGRVDSAALNRFFDRSTIWAQEARRDIGRALDLVAGAANGWTPIEALESIGDRRLRKIVDWIGGLGPKPPVGQYVGALGLTADPSLATDLRGAAGAGIKLRGIVLDVGSLPSTGDEGDAWAIEGDLYVWRTGLGWQNAGPLMEGVLEASNHIGFSTTELASRTVPFVVTTVQTNCYNAEGDRGAARWRRAATPGPAAGKRASLDGWWELDEPIPALTHFGADSTGVVPCDAAFAEFVAYLRQNPTEPSGGNAGWGMQQGYIPKGKFTLTQGLSLSSFIGLRLVGAAKHATSLEYHKDTGSLFNLGVNMVFSLENMSIVHVPENSDRSTWTCALVERTGIGGGRNFFTLNLHTRNFAFFDKNTGTVNNDTSLHILGDFQDVRTLIYGRSSQAVINKFLLCSVFLKTERILDVAGYGYTEFDTCNLVVDGTWIYLANTPSLWGQTANIKFKNTKGEPWNSLAHAGGSRTSLIDFEGAGNHIAADITFEQVGFSSSVTLDPLYPQIRVPGGVRVRWDGGNFSSSSHIETVGVTATANNWGVKPRILLENLRGAPAPANVIRTGAAGTYQQCITWKECIGVPNMTAAINAVSSISEARQVNVVTALAYGTITSGNSNIDLSFGCRQRIEEIVLFLQRKMGGDLVVNVYSDAARTALVDTLTITSADNTGAGVPLIRRLAGAVDKIVTDGLFFTVTATVAHEGHIMATHIAC